MCGIAGYLCTRGYEPRLAAAVPLLGMFMQERGKHSWGMTNGSDVVKLEGAFAAGYEGQFAGAERLLLHTRFATFGEKVKENSHPFLIKGILGVHNGQVYNHRTIAEKYDIDYKVDSEIIFHRLADGGSMKEIDAYGAVVFFQNDVLHIGKFQGGQMTLVKCSWGWVWASTFEAVKFSLRMSGLLGTAQFEVKMKEGKLYKMLGDTLAKDSRKLDFEKVVYTPTVTAQQTSFSSHNSDYGYGYRCGRRARRECRSRRRCPRCADRCVPGCGSTGWLLHPLTPRPILAGNT